MKMVVGGGFLQILSIIVVSLAPVCGAYGEEPKSGYEGESVSGVRDTIREGELQKFEEKKESEVRPRIQDMVTNVPADWFSVGSIAVESRSLPFIAGTGVLTGLLITADRQTNGFSRRIMASSEALRSWSSGVVRLGDGKTHLALAAGFGLYGLLWDDSRAIRTGSQTVEALLSCGIAVQLMKRIAGRESPQAASSDRGTWRCFPNLRTYQRHQSRYYAFPSGHISTAMATLTVISENYSEVTWIRPVGYSLMACLGVSLVNVGYHWYSDFPLGIALGYMFGKVTAHKQPGLFASLTNDSYSGLRVLPSVTKEGTGVTLALLF